MELPDNYRFELRRKLKEAVKEDKKINWRVISSIAAGLIIMVISVSMLSGNFSILGKEKKDNLALKERGKIESSEENIAFDMNKSMEIAEEERVGIKSFMDSSEENTNNDLNSPPSDNDTQFKESTNDFSTMASRSSIGIGRKSVKEAYLSLDIDGLNSVSEKITNYANENGGFIENLKIETNENDSENTQKKYLIKIRIPSDKFDQTLDFLKEIGRLVDEQSVHSDITEKYFRIETNLRNLYDQENKLLEILNKADNIQDILLVEDELEKIKEGISSESLALEQFDNSISLSTINAKFTIVNE